MRIAAPDRSIAARPRRRLEMLIERRIGSLAAWLARHAPFCVREQAHLDDGTRERAYWHYGYLVAMADMRAELRNGRRAPKDS